MSEPQPPYEDTLASVLCERIEQLNELEREMRGRHLKLAQILGELSAWAAQTRPQDGIRMPIHLTKLPGGDGENKVQAEAEVASKSSGAGSSWWMLPIVLIAGAGLTAAYMAWQGATQEIRQLRKELESAGVIQGGGARSTGSSSGQSTGQLPGEAPDKKAKQGALSGWSPQQAEQGASGERDGGAKVVKAAGAIAGPDEVDLLELRPRLFASRRKCPSKETAALRRFRDRLAATRGVPVRQNMTEELVSKLHRACPHNRSPEQRSAALQKLLAKPDFLQRQSMAHGQSSGIPDDPRFDLRSLWLPGAKLDRINLSFSDLRGAHLEGSQLFQSDLRETQLQGAFLVGTNLTHAKLAGAKLSKAHLEGANLNAADLRGAVLDGADLRAVRLPHANLEGASMNGVTLRLASFEQTNLKKASLKGVSFKEVALRGVDLSEADLSGSKNLDCKRLLNADSFRGATLPAKLKNTQCFDVVNDPDYWQRRSQHAVGDVQGRERAKAIADDYWKQRYQKLGEAQESSSAASTRG